MEPRSHQSRRPVSRPIGICLLLISLLSVTDAVAAPSASGFDPTSGVQDERSLVIEGEVERIVSEMRPRGMIASRAAIAVDHVVQGMLQDDRVTVGYEGGTVGDLTLRVSTEPFLVEGMYLRARLTPGEDGDYRIANPDADLTFLGGIGAMYDLTGQTWDDTDIPVPFRINPNTDDVPSTGEHTAVQNALATWTNATCSYFTYSYQSGACTIANPPQMDGINCVEWTSTPGGGPLAISRWWMSGERIIESDITFYDSGISWSTNPSSGQFDVESVALHELGHSLGLAHSSYNSAVMYYSIGAGVERRSLHSDDRDGVCALYPAPIPELGQLPASLAFTYNTATAQMSPTQHDLTPTNVGNDDPLDWNVTKEGAWFTVSPASGSTPNDITITPDGDVVAGLPVGHYTGAITVTVTDPPGTTNGVQRVDLGLDVIVPQLGGLPGSLRFIYFYSETVSLPSIHYVTPENVGSGDTLIWELAFSSDWLTASVTSGQTPDEFAIMLHEITATEPVTYTGWVTVTVTDPVGTEDPVQAISVTMVARPGGPSRTYLPSIMRSF